MTKIYKWAEAVKDKTRNSNKKPSEEVALAGMILAIKYNLMGIKDDMTSEAITSEEMWDELYDSVK